jgi:hypothetical protein
MLQRPLVGLLTSKDGLTQLPQPTRRTLRDPPSMAAVSPPLSRRRPSSSPVNGEPSSGQFGTLHQLDAAGGSRSQRSQCFEISPQGLDIDGVSLGARASAVNQRRPREVRLESHAMVFLDAQGARRGVPFYCDSDRASASCRRPDKLAAGDEEAVFWLYVTLSMYQALRDV